MKKIIPLFIISFLILGSVYFINSDYYRNKRTAQKLISAIESDNYELVVSIIEKTPECINTLPTLQPWWFRAFTEQPEVLYPMQSACCFGNYDIVKFLIDNGADCNITSKGIGASSSPLICAIISGSVETVDVVKLLLENGADVHYKDIHGKNAFDYANELEIDTRIVILPLLKQSGDG